MSQTSKRNKTFGQLLSGAINSTATFEGKTASTIEIELGEQIGLSNKTVQRYKAGYLPPDARTVEILAEVAVQRAFFGRQWLQRFLHAARYPFAEKLLDQLCPTGPARPRPPRVYENLPAPTYSQFVPRPQAYADVIDGLQQRSAMILIFSLGGMGKTSLAREVAAHSLQGDQNVPKFDAVVWVSDEERHGTTTLSIVLDEIARTLDYPGFTQFEHEEKRYEIEQLLRRLKVLLVIDNFETITDEVLLAWLLRLPEPSKAIVTSREFRRQFRSSWPVELRGMTDNEAQELINERLRVLKIEKMGGDQTQFEPLVAVTGGNPKAITVALGLIKYERRPLQQVVDDLYAARGALFDGLFTHAWALLDEAAKQVLLAMTFFKTSANEEALRASADVQGFTFERAVERLTDLALLDVYQPIMIDLPRYTLHPLVRAFAAAKLRDQPRFEALARERWVEWYKQLAHRVGFCWNNVHQLELLDPEQETVYSVIEWTLQSQHYAETLQIAKDVGYYYFVRGLWDSKPSIHLMAAEAAQKQSKFLEEIKELAYHVQLLSRQENFTEVETHLPRLYHLARSMQTPRDIFFEFEHARALYFLARREIDEALQIWQKILSTETSVYKRVSIRDWIAASLYEKAMLAESQKLLRDALYEAIEHNIQRAIISIQIKLIVIDLDQGNLDTAAKTLAMISLQADEFKDRYYAALIRRAYARLHSLRGEWLAARTALLEAIDLFERIGLRRELAEARRYLTQLESKTDLMIDIACA